MLGNIAHGIRDQNERRFSFFGNDFRYKTHVIPAVVVSATTMIIPDIEYSLKCGVERSFLFHSALFSILFFIYIIPHLALVAINK